ncbi:hypothetical protein T12_2610 [Trichinella patagoniensis]|uniref:Uncharacterized protein n=1 Tax=Trichinella patagoniensis TaxID=990121 RepID=A0A0V0Z5V9_9BILA|nr:hypothetical protein T12_2610 [Trichinella patagoniensis]
MGCYLNLNSQPNKDALVICKSVQYVVLRIFIGYPVKYAIREEICRENRISRELPNRQQEDTFVDSANRFDRLIP